MSVEVIVAIYIEKKTGSKENIPEIEDKKIFFYGNGIKNTKNNISITFERFH